MIVALAIIIVVGVAIWHWHNHQRELTLDRRAMLVSLFLPLCRALQAQGFPADQAVTTVMDENRHRIRVPEINDIRDVLMMNLSI